MTGNGLRAAGVWGNGMRGWKVPAGSTAFDEAGIKAKLLLLELPCYVARDGDRIGVSTEARWDPSNHHAEGDLEVLCRVPPLPTSELGDAEFRKTHGTQYAYYAGAMANGIASEEMVIALGKEGILGSFGSA